MPSTRQKRSLQDVNIDAESGDEAAEVTTTVSQRSKSKRAKKSRKKKAPLAKDAEEEELENFLFGSAAGNVAAPAAVVEAARLDRGEEDGEDEKADAEEDVMFFMDRGGVDDDDAKDDDEEGEDEAGDASKDTKRNPLKTAVWEDEDDSNIKVDLSAHPRLRKLRVAEDEAVVTGREYTERLQSKFKELNYATDWAERPSVRRAKRKEKRVARSDDEEAEAGEESESEPEELDFLTSSGALTSGHSKHLMAHKIDVSRVKDANFAARSQAVVKSVKFHPNGQMLMTAGMDKSIRLFQVDGVLNSLIQTVRLPDMPIQRAAFSHDGAHVIATGRRKFIYRYDLVGGSVSKVQEIRGRAEKSWETFMVDPSGKYIAFAGNNGYIVLVDAKNMRWIANLKMNGSVRALQFNADGSWLYSIGSEGMVYVWNLITRRCIFRHRDDGSVHGTALGVSPSASNPFYATGSDSGVVNMYSSTNILEGEDSGAQGGMDAFGQSASTAQVAPSPVKSIMNLTTPVDDVLFNHDGQLMMMRSQRKKDAVKLVHVASQTAYSNWPTAQTPFHFATSMDFSPNGGFLAVGNARGKVLLYRLHHYSRA